MRILFLVIVLIVGNLFCLEARASRVERVEAERCFLQARKNELAGNLEGARHEYSKALMYGISSRDSYKDDLSKIMIGGETLSAIGRRALALQAELINRESATPSGKLHLPELIAQLQAIYGRMEEIEPSNPNWYYLDAVIVCDREHHYVKARRQLKKCLRCPGNPQVKAKANKLLAHINPAANQQQIWLDIDGKKAREQFRRVMDSGPSSGRTSSWRPPSSSSSSSSGSSTPDWERRARNAESRGDYGAADRFRSGNSSVSDSARHW